MQELLQYIVSGNLPDTFNADIEKLDSIVSKVKSRSEVTTEFMKQWDRELSLRWEENSKSAINLINFCRSKNIPADEIRQYIAETYKFNSKLIDYLFETASKQ